MSSQSRQQNAIQQQKKKLRRSYRTIRQELPDELRREHDRAINHHVERLCSDEGLKKVAGYLAFDGEPEITAALTALHKGETEVYLPIIGAGPENNPLGFRRYSPRPDPSENENLEPNRYGIHEPVIGALCEVAELDVILLPLVAWDKQGGRLGMGAGYYDRALFETAQLERPMRIGIAYDAQCDNALPMNEFDVRLHGVITENGLFTLSG